MVRRWHTAVVAILALGALACEGTGQLPDPDPSTSRSTPAGPVGDYPSSMAALGDSISVAFGSCLVPAACPRNSWATGDGTHVDSHYERVTRANPAMRRHARNFAVPSATVAGLAGQAASATGAKAEYVTILIGANDACRPRIEEMTDVATFRTRLGDALGTLRRDLPNTRVLVVSIPNVYRVWEVGRTNRAAVAAWSLGICPSLLANPNSTAEADVNRRQAFRDRITAYNGQLAAACKAYGARCRYDGGAVHRVSFGLDLISAQDFFHPNAAGQSALAKASYPERFGW